MIVPDGELEEVRRRLLPDHPDLGRTTWTASQVSALERAAEEHVDGCDECQGRLDAELEWCPVGESLHEAAASAALEWSWQVDFPSRDDLR